MSSEPVPPAPAAVPPELLAWAQQTFDAREYLDGLRDIKETGGEPLAAFIAEIEAVVRRS
ncbi:hypothetical protein BH10PLA2_BH10PLA2_40290 [soil metagenome]